MFEILRFGAGWEGDLKEIDELEDVIVLFGRPECQEVLSPFSDTPNDSFQEYEFTAKEYEIDGSIYQVAYNGSQPTIESVKKAVIKHKPKPIR